ncbi:MULTISPECIES: lactate utilization protein [Oceanotoga]|jgi:hypothetical protein|uniref:lactate utilization protein n=1 Tax=Oceanotoga TaxID=1255275 RepID=UPI00264ECDE2|nr:MULTISPECIES: lactate utilization protein [Oceanotoga]MDN5343748.1 hypothetical protein [Oceanotoga sp.]MDO7977590.1 lactate utilization protein [Oceanotoga teriensis]
MRDELYKWKFMSIGNEIIENLRMKKHEAYLVESSSEALEIIKKLIPENSKVTVGGSITLSQTGIIDYLENSNINYISRKNAKNSDEMNKVFLESFTSDFFICSANAITYDGKIVQLDGNGSRVAPMIWGPKNVIIVAGMNKVVNNLEEANSRITYIAPMNAKRLNTKTPCTRLGECIDCESRERICVHKTILETGVRHPGRFKIVLIAENLGL